MSRGPEEIHHEAQYWSLALDDVNELNEAIARIVGELVEAPLALLELAILEGDAGQAEPLMAMVGRVLRELAAMQPHVTNLLDLARGRYRVLGREVAELDDDGDE